MAAIGNITCTFVKGHCPTPKMRLELWHVPGLDSYGVAAMGRNDAEFEVLAVLFSNTIGVMTWKGELESLQGQIVTITNDLGIPFANCLIAKLGPLKSVPVLTLGGITQRGEMTVAGVVLA
jgi:hypothetical protein